MLPAEAALHARRWARARTGTLRSHRRRASTRSSSGSAPATTRCSPARWCIGASCSSRTASLRRGVAAARAVHRRRTSSRRSTAGSSSSTCARRPARGSRRPSCCSRRSSRRSSARFPSASSRSSSTTSACTTYGVALAVGSNATVGPADGDMLVQLNERALRLHVGLRARSCARRCPRSIPDVTFFFQPADMVNQVLNLGLPAPIDVQVVGSESRRQLRRSRSRLAARDRAHSRRGRRARAAGDGRAGDALQRRPHEGAADRVSRSATSRATCSSRSARAARPRRTSGSIPPTACSTP